MIILILLLLCSPLYAQSTGTVIVPELTQEQIDWNSIISLSTDTITALKLAKQDEEYAYLRGKINEQQAVLEISKWWENWRKIKEIGHAHHIYPDHISNRIIQIEVQDRNNGLSPYPE